MEHGRVLDAGAGYASYVWNDGSTDQTVIAGTTGKHHVTVTDARGCGDKDSVIITEIRPLPAGFLPGDTSLCSYNILQLKTRTPFCPTGFYMPNAFSPENSIGKNDVCRPLLYGNVVKYRFAIYNRWGQRIYESSDRYQGWDGKINGITVNSGTFAWVCTFQFSGEKEQVQKGTVLLIR